MKLGYPCLNYALKPLKMSTFRLASYSPERMEEAVGGNLQYLIKMLEYNGKHGFGFFRISSDMIPFASHPVCKFDWLGRFASGWKAVGKLIQKNGFRISMHPSQFVVLNGTEKVLENAVGELDYHAKMLDAMGLDDTAKVQIHVGGVYGDKPKSVDTFIRRYRELPKAITRRLVIENDERSYSLHDCLRIHEATGIPIIFDSFHHEILNNGESWDEGVRRAAKTWSAKDGQLMLDYSSQDPGERVGNHCQTIDVKHFTRFLTETHGHDFDIMLEIKDKEASAEKALAAIKKVRK